MTSPDAERVALTRRLYGEHHAKLVSYLLRRTRDPEAAEDLAEEAWTQFLVAELSDDSNPIPLVYVIARCRLQDWRRKRIRRGETPVDDEDLVAFLEEVQRRTGSYHYLDEDSIISKIDIAKAISSLKAQVQKAIMLYYFDDLSRETVAKLMGISDTRVKQLLAEARKSLAESPTLVGYLKGGGNSELR